MPTKSELLSPIRKGAMTRENSRPVLSVRPLSLDTDLRVIYKWISEDSSSQLPPADQGTDFLEEAYSGILASDAVQTFIGLVDDDPLCQIELSQIRQHVISLSYESFPDDHYLDILPAPPDPREHMGELLKSALDYFFSLTHVGRIMAEADLNNEWMNKLLKSAGFHLQKKISVPYRNSNLYFCTKRSLIG